MKIKSNLEYDNLIVQHYKVFLEGFDVLALNETIKSKINNEKITADLLTTEECIKISCFLSSSFLDLLTTLKGFHNATTEWEVIFYSKQGYLSIFETVITYQKYQNSVRKILKQNHSAYVNTFNDLNKILRDYKKYFNFDTDIYKYRNHTAAHYDKNILIYFEQIQKIDINDAIQAIERFLSMIKLLMQFVYVFIEELESKTINNSNINESSTLKELDSLIQILILNK